MVVFNRYAILAVTTAVGLSTSALACGNSDSRDREAAIDFLAGGEEFLKVNESHRTRIRELTDDCLRRAGFQQGFQSTQVDEPAFQLSPEETRYYGIVNTAEKLQSQKEIPAVSTQPTVHLSAAERTAYKEALDGSSTEPGCAQEARTTADAEYHISEINAIGPLVDEIRAEHNVSQANEAYLAKWSLCMAAAGFDEISHRSDIYSTVRELWRQDYLNGSGSDRALKLEGEIFEADNECADQPPQTPMSLAETAELLLDENPHLAELLAELTSK